MQIWLNGEIQQSEAATLSATAAGVTLGWGVFTTIGIWHGHPFALERHLSRLRHDAAATDISIAFTDATIQSALHQVVAQNSIQDGYARLTLTRRGDGRWNGDVGSDFSILVAERPPSGNAAVKLGLSLYRLEARRPLAGVKATAYLGHQWAWREMTAQGFDEAVLCNSQGALCECARANLFWVSRGEVRTPALDSGCLPGIAREIILEWLMEMGIESRQGIFSPHELAGADEVFITTAATGPRAVATYTEMDYEGTLNTAEINRVEHSYAAPGPITQLLKERWQQAVDEE
ncbi:MAG: aminotransferase class IV [Abitibacteriaceae bacterium]|nr:aminotransferase class IV [Abditibacteriaceae bacterium]MBV9866902.1 aminotransferase class IV [Abditibacteriaceae bacterium]